MNLLSCFQIFTITAIVLLNFIRHCNTDISIEFNKFISSNNPCKNTLIISTSNAELQFGLPNSIPIVLQLQTNFTHTDTNVAPWNLELLDQDIYHPYAFGTNRFTTNCAIVTINGHWTSITYSLLFQKLVRRNIDYFIEILQYGDNLPSPTTRSQRSRFRYHNYYVLKTSEFIETGCPIEKLICRKLLQNRPLSIAHTNSPEKIRYQIDKDGNLIGPLGPYYKMIQLAQKLYNISRLRLTVGSGGGSAGIKRNDGSWIGALGDVFGERVDVAVVIGASFSRHRIADFSSSMDRYTRVFYVSPGNYGIRWTAIFRPYTALVWLLILIAVIITTIFVYGFAKKEKVSQKLSITFFVGAMLKILFEQPTNLLNMKSQRNILIFTWLTFCFLIGNGYRSQLMSFLTQTEPLEIVPRTHKELAEASNYKIYFRYYGGAAYAYTINSNLSIHKAMTPRIILVNSSDECIILALSDHSACMDYYQSGDAAISGNTSLYFTANPTNILYKSIDADLSVAMVWAFRKGSPIIQEFSQLILYSMASGLHDYWIEQDQLEFKIQGTKWLSGSGENDSNSKLKQQLKIAYEANILSPGLDLKSLQGLMFILIFGLGIGLVIFVIEQMYKLLKN